MNVSKTMNIPKTTLVLAVLSIAGIVLASFATAMVLLPPKSDNALPAARPVDVNIAKAANDLPAPIALQRTPVTPKNVSFTLETTEVVGEIDSGATYLFWTFNKTVPGPFLRVLYGDNVTITIKNSGTMTHSIDLHAVIGPGGGSVKTQTGAGQMTRFWFKALHPGLYVYHCATAPVDHHIANGMYGLILVEPAGGLPTKDLNNNLIKEFYVMQGDFYTEGSKGQAGHHDFNVQPKSSTQLKMLSANPDYVVFNGKVNSLVGTGNALTADVGQTVRIYFGVGGPNLVSSFHIIGEIFENVYPEGSFDSTATIKNVQTTLVPAGGSTMVEFGVPVAGDFLLVDHSLTRAIQKGAVGFLSVSGTSLPGIFGP